MHTRLRVLRRISLCLPSNQKLVRYASMPAASGLSNVVAPTPRPSASLVVVNERNEILLVRRNPKASAFAGMHVRCSDEAYLHSIDTPGACLGISRR